MDEPAAGYSSVILEHFRRPRNRRRMEDASAVGQASNPLCGDSVRFAIRVNGGRIADAAFEAEACAICIASASLLTGLAEGMTPEALGSLAEATLEEALSTDIRPARKRCVTLPLEAARAAVNALPGPAG